MPTGAAHLLVDTSYVVFHRYYATAKWYRSFIDCDASAERMVASPLFHDRFTTSFERQIARLARENGVPWANVVFATDCGRDKVWRRDVFSNYKNGRNRKKNFDPVVFEWVYSDVIPRVAQSKGARVMGHARAEADDIIAVLHAHIRAEFPDAVVVIATNDSDYVQLHDDATKIVNMSREDVSSRRGTLSAQDFLQCRILSGDKSDNIAGALPRCHMRTAQEIVEADSVASVLRATHGAEKRYAMNNTLMNLRNVPASIRVGVLENFARA